MEDNKIEVIQKYINESFLQPYLLNDVTDITYNGKDLFIEDRINGKYRVKCHILLDTVKDFLSHLANLTGKNFNALNPILDISFLNYRLNAIHPLIAKMANKGVYTFALRIYSTNVVIKNNDYQFCPLEIHDLLNRIVKNKKSIIISGKTGVGKTEFQKYLVGYMLDNTKVVIIEDLYETYLKELYPNLDITSWVSFDNQKDIEEEYQKLIKAALRNNPDWLMIAEVRGKEANELYNAFTTGHPFIATIHAKSSKLSLKRFAQMMKNEDKSLLTELGEYINFSIHLAKNVLPNGKTIRFIESIVENSVINNRLVQKEIYHFEKGIKLSLLSREMKKILDYKERKNEKE